mmetsp:Transcript_114614/g.319161  ORF Transcript_114614/g.319161 Transcript_114614/m.319161 type:complete len:236 (+) Transcript_114614:217-924(+)
MSMSLGSSRQPSSVLSPAGASLGQSPGPGPSHSVPAPGCCSCGCDRSAPAGRLSWAWPEGSCPFLLRRAFTVSIIITSCGSTRMQVRGTTLGAVGAAGAAPAPAAPAPGRRPGSQATARAACFASARAGPAAGSAGAGTAPLPFEAAEAVGDAGAAAAGACTGEAGLATVPPASSGSVGGARSSASCSCRRKVNGVKDFSSAARRSAASTTRGRACDFEPSDVCSICASSGTGPH